MIGLLQRMRACTVTSDGSTLATGGPGLLVLVGIEQGDGPAQAHRLAERLLAYRVFPDAAGRMNLSLADTGGDLVLVPQFTLVADTGSGNRPGFSRAAPPDSARLGFDHLVAAASSLHPSVQAGLFGADMDVQLVNQGPVTFWLRVAPDPR